MKANRLFMCLVLIILITSQTACERSITKTKPTEPAAAQAVTPGATEVMDQIYLFATQTKLAAEGIIQPQVTQSPLDLTQVVPTVVITSSVPLDQPTLIIPTPQPTLIQVIPPTPTPGLPATYAIQKGEFPYCLARRYNINPVQLLNYNGLSSAAAASLPTGTVLKIPQNADEFPGTRALQDHPTTYVVKSGDTIYSIACYFGDVDPNAIIFVNGLTEPYKLTVGQTIQIP
jgi:LysM repeat protein